MVEKERILFVDENNASCSQMAELLLRHHGGADFEAFSAGLHPQPVDPRTQLTLQAFGVGAAELASKSIDRFREEEFDFLVSLCDLSDEEQRRLPRARERMTWHFGDPKVEDEVHAGAFSRCLQQLNERIKMLLLILARRGDALVH